MYYTYIIRCRDNSLYTGYTIDIKRRLREHTKGINSKYTRSRGFSKLEIYFVCKKGNGKKASNNPNRVFDFGKEETVCPDIQKNRSNRFGRQMI